MCGEIEAFVNEGRTDKAMRWLGFVQGVLWMAGVYSLHEMQNHNRPAEDESHG
jgi:hypothetical protein